MEQLASTLTPGLVIEEQGGCYTITKVIVSESGWTTVKATQGRIKTTRLFAPGEKAHLLF